MKTTNRARRNAGKQSTSAQSATAPKNAPGETPTEPVSIGVVANIGNTSLGQLTIPEVLSDALVARSTREGFKNVQTLILHILREEDKAERRRLFPSVEFESVMGR